VIENIIKGLLPTLLKNYKGDVSFLGVGQKTTIARIWTGIRAFGMKYSIGVFVERTE
jgi:hypothetical protein